MRSVSESVNSMDKTRSLWKIRRMIPHRKDTAGSLRVYIHNMRRYVYMTYIQPEFISPVRTNFVARLAFDLDIYVSDSQL